MARRNRPRRGRDQPRHRFRSRPSDPKKQAAGIVKRLQGARVRSVGTGRNYQERLVQIAARLDVALTALTPERAVAYLKGRAAGRDGVVYTVAGKGGLVREVLLPHRLAERLEAHRLDAAERVVDRGVRYLQRYDVGGGKAFSASFSRASMEALGKSCGAHGLRYGFARQRMRELMHHAEHRLALAIVSGEMGHFRAAITSTYLR